ncbi:MAG: NAD(P)/FAD-dependent oxidoreductase [Lentisphaeria bacterium]|nr:NAD(P)/FAD-dependent oxidoreductase [Lentisphaeria bacterium]
MEEYDVAIIGAGVTGLAAAYSLARYKLSVLVLEKNCDASFGVSKANSGIVHGGFHYPASTLKGRLEIRGNRLFGEYHRRLHFPFRRCGILLAAFTKEELAKAKELYEQGKNNGVPGIELCSKERLLELEEKLSPDVLGGLYAPEGGVVEPYGYAFALAEIAEKNGTVFRYEEKVLNGKREGDFWEIRTEKEHLYRAKYIVNAAGLYADEISRCFGAEEFVITPRKGEEYLLDRLAPCRPSKVIFPVPVGHSKGVLVIPTCGGTTMVGPTSSIVSDKEEKSTTEENRKKIFSLACRMIPSVSEKDLISAFSGSRPVMEGEDFYIAPSGKVPCFIQAAGILSPGLTASPAVGELIRDLLEKEGLVLEKNPDFLDSLPERKTLREMTDEEADEMHKKDPAWTKIVCRCEKISEAEIVEAIRKGHTTLDGIKFYTRSGMGRCQGGFCSGKILEILARETGKSIPELTKRGEKSFLTCGPLTAPGKEGEKR